MRILLRFATFFIASILLLASGGCTAHEIREFGKAVGTVLVVAAILGTAVILAERDTHQHHEHCGHARRHHQGRWVYHYHGHWEYHDPHHGWHVYE